MPNLGPCYGIFVDLLGMIRLALLYSESIIKEYVSNLLHLVRTRQSVLLLFFKNNLLPFLLDAV